MTYEKDAPYEDSSLSVYSFFCGLGRPVGFFLRCLLTLLVSPLLFAVSSAQAEEIGSPRITENVDEGRWVTLGGNTRPEAKAKYDRGPVADSLLLEHMLLLLKRSPEQERELEKFIDELHDASSPNFHRWLTAEEFGERFGVGKQDRETIKKWLRSHGLKVSVDYPNGLLIDFSGTAGQVREAFHAEIHNLDVKGVKHIANMSDPKIPAALAPAIAGVVSLHDFLPRPMYRPRPNYTVAVDGKTQYLVTPGDLATIYNLNPLFTAGISGQGQTIVVIEDTDVYTTADWTSFRSVFGLSSYTDGSFTEIHPAPPSGTNNCSDPGVISSDLEAIIDAEYASASAPSAAIVLASCTGTETFGGLIALQNLLNESAAPPALVSLSYGECEAANAQRRMRLSTRLSSRRSRKASQSSFPRATMRRLFATDTTKTRSMVSESPGMDRVLITCLWGAPTLGILMRGPTARIGVPLIRRAMNRPSPIFRRFPGTIPAAAY